ncbi:MAG: mechanosensitive ion channel domain-containing protein [Pseudomonadota bacterium]
MAIAWERCGRAAGAGAAWRRHLARPRAVAVIAVLMALVWVAVVPQGAAAQGFDLNRLLGPGGPGAPAQSMPDDEAEAPRQSRPLTPPTFREGAPPTAEDYSRLAAQSTGEVSGASPAGASPVVASIDTIEGYLDLFRTRLKRIVNRVPDALGEVMTTLRAASPTGRPVHFIGIAVFAGLLLVIGRAVSELFLAFIARPIFVNMQRPNPVGYVGKLPALIVRYLLMIISTALTVAVAAAVGVGFHDGHHGTLVTVIVIFAVYAAVILAHTFWRVVLAPFLPAYRLMDITDREAAALYRWLSMASIVSIIAAGFSHWIDALGLPREIMVGVTSAATLVSVVMLLIALRVNRRAITAIMMGGPPRGPGDPPPTWLQQMAGYGWAPAAFAYLSFTWADLFFRLVMGIEAGAERIMAPFLVLVLTMLVYALVVYLSDRVFARQRRIRAMNAEAAAAADGGAPAPTASDAGLAAAEDASGRLARTDGPVPGDGSDGGSDEDGPQGGPEAVSRTGHGARRGSGMRSFEDLARRVASLLALGTASWLVVWYWGGRTMFAESAFFGVAEDVIDVVFIGYVAFHAARIWLDRKIAEEGADDDPTGAVLDGEGGGAGATRIATLLPLVRNFILTVIAVTSVLLVMVEMGVNVAPLFAGAGVVGLAIGFGAQTLVRDIISGAFFLLDDAFRKGEYIDVGSVKGTVEKISIRSFQLRHHLGMLHTIPFGEIQYLTNFSRDWVMMKLPLRLTYDTDIEKVRKLIKKLGIRLMDDPEIGQKFLQPLKSQGVIQMEDSAMIVRVKFMTRPGDQWVTRKRVFAEIRQLFEAEGIKFAHREVTVRIPDIPESREMTSEQREAIGAAARANLDVIEAENRRMTGTGGTMDDR